MGAEADLVRHLFPWSNTEGVGEESLGLGSPFPVTREPSNVS